MAEVTEKDAEDAIKKGAKKITEDDIKRVINKHDEIEEKFKNNGPLTKFFADFKLLFSVVKDYTSGEYREVPVWTIAAIAFALLYVLSPIDIIPDFIPLVGYVDDAFVVAACLNMVRQDLSKYEEWKKNKA